MDHNDSTPIIKSGVRHSVQVAQGTKNAKSVRNVVTSDVDAPIEERIVNVQEGAMREAAPLQGGPDEERQLARSPAAGVEEEAGGAAASAAAAPEQAESRPQSALAPEAPPAPGPAGAGPVLVQHARGEEDAFAAKAQPGADKGVHVQEPTPAALAENMVSEDASRVADNRQRIEQVQAEANRIRLDNPAATAENRVQIQPGAPVRKQLDIAEATRSPAAAPEPVAQPGGTSAAAAPEAELPPEVAANLGQRTAAMPSKESDLMARLRAIKSNMSVTENRLTKLHHPEPPKS